MLLYNAKLCTVQMPRLVRRHLFKSALRDGHQAGTECLGFYAQTANHVANLHLLKLVTPFPLLVHVTPNLSDSPARIFKYVVCGRQVDTKLLLSDGNTQEALK